MEQAKLLYTLSTSPNLYMWLLYPEISVTLFLKPCVRVQLNASVILP
jgi:hypothetical protein